MPNELKFEVVWDERPIMTSLMQAVAGETLVAITDGKNTVHIGKVTRIVTLTFKEGEILDEERINRSVDNLWNVGKEMGFRVYSVKHIEGEND